MTVEIAFCLDCNEINYAMTSAGGVFERANMSSNHAGHRQHVFGAPVNYCAPVRNVLTKLQAMAPITHNEMVLFKLALRLADDVPGDLFVG